jgi:hypothetical protein
MERWRTFAVRAARTRQQEIAALTSNFLIDLAANHYWLSGF